VKKAVTFRIDPDLLERARQAAEAENRTLTNFIETVLRARVETADRPHENRSFTT
jgi:predicted HicB family RNase H-like nuclease